VFRSYYATPIEQGFLPWALDFTPDAAGAEPFPLDYFLNPYGDSKELLWTTEDWDPALRFWTLPYDPNLTEWLRSADRGTAATMATLEIGGQQDKWDPKVVGDAFLEDDDLKWKKDAELKWPNEVTGFPFIQGELEQLILYMQNDRANYITEADVQADNIPAYFIHFIGADSVRHPATMELIRCALTIGNVVYMVYKKEYKRVRPSTLCPGLTPSFGPPGHPAFPSGHSFLSHLIALLLLEIPGLYRRLGVYREEAGSSPKDGKLLHKPNRQELAGRGAIRSPLLQIARRIAVNRERMGLHYPSDSYAGRHIAAELWHRLLGPVIPDNRICSPTLLRVLDFAKQEWPTPWPPAS
jgi:membrane-associated phospholipid phosphatase